MKSMQNARMSAPPRGWTNSDTQKRIDFIKKHKAIDYAPALTEKPENLKGIIEQYVSYQALPTAVASPLVLHGEYAQGAFIVPVCTVEGTLVYSLTRGMMATAEHGITVRHMGQRVSRAPMFMLHKVSDIKSFFDFVDAHYEGIKAAAESTTRHGKLLEIKKLPIHTSVVLDMVFSTGNAAGQNMVTIASKAACEYIQKHFSMRNYYLESGFNCDKKASRRTLVEGRGHSIIAESRISKKTLKMLLGIDVEQLITFVHSAIAVGQFTGLLGSNLHIANAIASIYLATGQDMGCVAENSVGNLDYKKNDDDSITIFLTLPSLTVGTVGGGTRLPSQKRNLELLGCVEGENSAKKLAEIIGGAALCLELSLLSAIISNTFAESHQKFGRT